MKTTKYPYGEIRPPYIQISLRTKVNMRERAFGEALADILWSSEPRYFPTRIGLDFKKETPCENQDDFLKKWCVLKTSINNDVEYEFPKTLHWKNKNSLKFDGSFSHKFIATTGNEVPGSLMATFSYRERIDWKSMFLALCNLMKPQLGMLHLFTTTNCPPNQREATFQTGHFHGLSKPVVPGLGWMFAAGEEFYESTMGAELKDLDVKRVDYGAYCILEIAKGADEILNNLPTFQARRDSLLNIFPIPILPSYNPLGLNVE